VKAGKRFGVGLLVLGLSALCPGVYSQKAVLGIDPSGANVLFGSPEAQRDVPTDSAGISYLQTGALLSGEGGNAVAAGDGILLFIQGKEALSGGMFRAGGGILALVHEDGFVSLYSGETFLPNSASAELIAQGSAIGSLPPALGSAVPKYLLRVFDGASGLWVNPAFFMPGLQDKAPPRIEELALLGRQGRYYIAENLKRGTQRMPQGDYTLAVRVVDPLYSKGAVSGIFRLKILLDGQIVSDRKFDSARITAQGLSFLELEAPSSKIVDDGGRLVLGTQFIARGTHILEFFAYDFAGNAGSFMWKFSAE